MSEAGVPIWKVQLVQEGGVKAARRPVASAEDAAAVVASYLKGADREHCVAVLLDARHKVIGLNTVSIGTVSASLVHPREVFKPAILANASAVILAHNHPSGELEPSEHDVDLTRRLIEAGKLLGIELLDHLILCDGAHLSLRASGKVSWGRTR